MPAIVGTAPAMDHSSVMNHLLWNPLGAFNFVLELEGVIDLACRRVHSFTKENEYEFIQEGGLNDYVHMRRKQITKPFTFKVERYVGTDMIPDPIELGTDLILPVLLMVFDGPTYSGRSVLPVRTYTFTGCTVMAKEYGELSAEQSGLLIETTTIGYREMVKLTKPIDAAQMYPKSFKWMEENKKTFYARSPKNDKVRATGDKWEFKMETSMDVDTGVETVVGGPKRKRAVKPKKDDSIKAEPVKWDGFSQNPPSTKRTRAVKPAKDDTKRAEAEKWDGFAQNPPSTKRKRAAKPAKDDTKRAEAQKWNGFAKNPPSTERKRAVKPAKADSERAPKVKLNIPKTPPTPDTNKAKWDGFAQNPPSTTRTRAVKPTKADSDRAPKVKPNIPKTPPTPDTNKAKWDGFAQNPPSTERTRAVKPTKADSERAPVYRWPESERRMMAQLLT